MKKRSLEKLIHIHVGFGILGIEKKGPRKAYPLFLLFGFQVMDKYVMGKNILVLFLLFLPQKASANGGLNAFGEAMGLLSSVFELAVPDLGLEIREKEYGYSMGFPISTGYTSDYFGLYACFEPQYSQLEDDWRYITSVRAAFFPNVPIGVYGELGILSGYGRSGGVGVLVAEYSNTFSPSLSIGWRQLSWENREPIHQVSLDLRFPLHIFQ